jgi:hypothetical protein
LLADFWPSKIAAEYMPLCKQNHPKKSTAITSHWYCHEMSAPPPFPVENPRKLKEKSRQKTMRSRVFLQRWVLDSIRLQYMKSYLAAEKLFFLFKGQGSFKNLKIGGNVEFSKAYRLIPLTPSPHWS